MAIPIKHNPDFAKHLKKQVFDDRTPKALDFIEQGLKNSSEWHSCYSLKQIFTSRVCYCYQRDFYEWLKMAGFKVKIDSNGDHWAKAEYRKSFRRAIRQGDIYPIKEFEPNYDTSQDEPVED